MHTIIIYFGFSLSKVVEKLTKFMNLFHLSTETFMKLSWKFHLKILTNEIFHPYCLALNACQISNH